MALQADPEPILQAVETDIEELRSDPNLSAFLWVLVTCVAMVGFLALLFIVWRHAIRESSIAF
jgi:hypothetical protein